MSNDLAAAEMQERIATLRSKAAFNRTTAERDEQQATEARRFALQCDQTADQYEAILAMAEA